jgi:hypothetical protein
MFLGIFEVAEFFVKVYFCLFLLLVGFAHLELKEIDKPLKEGFKVSWLKPNRLHLFFST